MEDGLFHLRCSAVKGLNKTKPHNTSQLRHMRQKNCLYTTWYWPCREFGYITWQFSRAVVNMKEKRWGKVSKSYLPGRFNTNMKTKLSVKQWSNFGSPTVRLICLPCWIFKGNTIILYISFISKLIYLIMQIWLPSHSILICRSLNYSPNNWAKQTCTKHIL